MKAARLLDRILRDYPGYTLATLLREDAHELLGMRVLIDPKLGESTADGE